MIKHIVMWKFKDVAEGKSREENIAVVKDGLYSLIGQISEIRNMEIGVDVMHTAASMDMMLLVEFDSVEDLKAYAADPRHLSVAEYIGKVVSSRIVLDYEM